MPTIQNLISSEKAANSIKSYQYPKNLGPHHIILEFLDFKTEQLNAAIALPPPITMQDSTEIQVGSADLGSFGAGVLAFLEGAGKDDTHAITEAVVKGLASGAALGEDMYNLLRGGDLAEAATKFVGANRFFARHGIDAIAPGAGLAFERKLGTTINPHATLNFDGVNLKAHSFSWSLSPTSSQEADDIHELIRVMKVQSLPRYAGPKDLGRSALLAYPDKVKISFSGDMKNKHYYSGVIKKGMINNITVDYTPNGVAMNKGGTPAFINLSLGLLEEEIHTREDYRDGGT